jgi:hypothetical protein
MRIPRRVISAAFVVLVAGLLSIGTLARVSAAGAGATSPASKAGLQLTVRVTNPGPLSPCTTTCTLAATEQLLLFVHDANPLANFGGPTGSPNRDTVPNTYVVSSVDETVTVNGAPYGGVFTVTPPPGTNFAPWSGHWVSTVVCTPATGPAPCTTVQSPAVLPGETTAVVFESWAHGSTDLNGTYVFTFTVHGTLNGRSISLTSKSPSIVMKP